MTDHLFALPLDVGRYMFVLCSSVYDPLFLAFLSHFINSKKTPQYLLALPYIFTVYFPMLISSLNHFTNGDIAGSLRTNYTDSWLSNQSVGHFPQKTGVIIHGHLL